MDFSTVPTRSTVRRPSVGDVFRFICAYLKWPFQDGGRKVVYGTNDGVYISDLREVDRDPIRVLALLDVLQVDVLEDYQLLIVLSGKPTLCVKVLP